MSDFPEFVAAHFRNGDEGKMEGVYVGPSLTSGNYWVYRAQKCLEVRFSNSEFQIQSFKFRVSKSEFQIQSFKFRAST